MKELLQIDNKTQYIVFHLLTTYNMSDTINLLTFGKGDERYV